MHGHEARSHISQLDLPGNLAKASVPSPIQQTLRVCASVNLHYGVAAVDVGWLLNAVCMAFTETSMAKHRKKVSK